jgi:hypothetical protein
MAVARLKTQVQAEAEAEQKMKNTKKLSVNFRA